MKITIRMDDITPDMDWESFEAFERMFRKYGIRPLLGVVPDNRDPKLSVDAPRAEFWERMRALQKEGWSLSMHGCHHVYHTKKGGQFPLNPQSEFAGRSRAEQERLLSDGKRILEEHGICTDIFMAPGHTFDRKYAAGFKGAGLFICDGRIRKTAVCTAWNDVSADRVFEKICIFDKRGDHDDRDPCQPFCEGGAGRLRPDVCGKPGQLCALFGISVAGTRGKAAGLRCAGGRIWKGAFETVGGTGKEAAAQGKGCGKGLQRGG